MKGTKTEDVKLSKEFSSLFAKRYAKSFPNFSVFQKPKFQEFLGYGAGAIYVSEIPIPEMTEKQKSKMGLRGDKVNGMIWVNTQINPHGITSSKDVGRTFTIKVEIYGEKKANQRT